jgi:large subunit ribosomal protein L4
MASVEVRSAAGKKVSSRDLPAEIFEAPVNVPLMHQVVVAGLAAARAGTHDTKTRAEVRGGGRKPWRQKGTGRARQGSNRAPQWAGGGVAHGPHPRSYEMRVNKKMKKGALRSALTDTAASGKLAAVDDFGFDGVKTKQGVSLLRSLELDGRVLVVIPEPHRDTELVFRNLPNVKVTFVGSLSVYDLLYADRVLFTAAALDRLEHGKPEASEDEPEEVTEA